MQNDRIVAAHTVVLGTVLLALAWIALVPGSVATAQDKATEAEEDNFGEMFIHPRDRHYLPDQAPSRATRKSSEDLIDPERGPVIRYEYQKGDTIFYRDVWEEPGKGTRGSFGLKFKF